MLLKTTLFSLVILFGITGKVLAIDLPIDAEDDDMILDQRDLPQELLEKIGEDEVEEISVSVDNKKRSINLNQAEDDGFVDLSEDFDQGQKFISELLAQDDDEDDESAIEEDRHSDLLDDLTEEQLENVFADAQDFDDAVLANRVAY